MAVTMSDNTVKVTSAEAVTTQRVRVRSIRWEAATTAGHTLSIQDNTGFEKFAAIAAGSNYTEESGVERNFDGITVATMSSGVLFLELEQVGLSLGI